MNTLEKILQEIDSATDKWGMVDYINDKPVIAKEQAKEIIKKHMAGEERTENASPSRNNNKWIPCDPENIPDTEVLCCDEYGEELIGYLSNTAEGWVCESDECIMYYVVAWQPKPEPYRKDGE